MTDLVKVSSPIFFHSEQAVHAAHACAAVSGTFWLLSSGQQPGWLRKRPFAWTCHRLGQGASRDWIGSWQGGWIATLLCGVRFIGQLNMQIELSVLSTRRRRRRQRGRGPAGKQNRLGHQHNRSSQGLWTGLLWRWRWQWQWLWLWRWRDGIGAQWAKMVANGAQN